MPPVGRKQPEARESENKVYRVQLLITQSKGEGSGNPLQYSCLGNPMDGGAWRVTVHGVAKQLDVI